MNFSRCFKSMALIFMQYKTFKEWTYLLTTNKYTCLLKIWKFNSCRFWICLKKKGTSWMTSILAVVYQDTSSTLSNVLPCKIMCLGTPVHNLYNQPSQQASWLECIPYLKIIIKHFLFLAKTHAVVHWVLKRTASLRQPFEHQNHRVKEMDKKIITIFGLIFFAYL